MGSDPAPELPLEEARAEAARLRDGIRRHEYLYYVEDSPEISDGEFDRLMRRLRELESSHPELFRADSPTQRVGGAPREGVEKASHSSALLSLDNALNEHELREFDRRARELLDMESIAYVGELKFDGVSMAVRYANRELQIALTRGDGQQGEIITPNARTLGTVLLSVSAARTGPRRPALRFRDSGRGRDAQAGVREAEPPACRGWRGSLRQPPQRGRGLAPDAGSFRHRQTPSRLLRLHAAG